MVWFEIDSFQTSTTMQHKTDLDYLGGLEGIAENLGNLRYDRLSHFLTMLSNKVKRDGMEDEKRGRPKLVVQLTAASTALAVASDQIAAAWKTSEPHMKEDGSC